MKRSRRPPKHLTSDAQIGIDIDWFASDLAGCVGYFTTGGHGPVPVNVAGANRDRITVFRYFRTASPQCQSIRVFDVSRKRLTRGADGFFESYEIMSNLGLYGYQFGCDLSESGSYNLLTQPTHPIVLSDLPNDISSMLKSFALPVIFSECALIGIDLI